MAEAPDTDQAIALAREVVKAGLLDKATALRLVQDFAAASAGGSFAHLLLARGIVDADGVRRLQAAAAVAAAGAASNASSSPSVWLRAGEPVDLRADATHASQRLRPAAPPGSPDAGERTMVLAPGNVLPLPPGVRPPSDGGRARPPDPPFGLSGRTVAYDPVLGEPAPGVAESGSREFDPIAGGGADQRLDSTASSSRDAPRGPGESIQLDGVSIAESTSGEGLLPQRQPEVGDRLGEYELESVLGAGGMGIIFKAVRAGTDQRFAIKVLMTRQGPAGEARRQRFAREVEVLRRLEHPNIVRIHGAGRHGLYDWYAMDWIEGRELGDLLAQGRLSVRQRLDMYVDICKAVAHAHERGVVHRDLKPGNVLIDPGDRIHVLDFGLAKVSDSEEARLTHERSSLGTPYYMAPEQLVSPKDVDHRADIFALGVLLYELLTGVRPFAGVSAVEVSNKILNHTPPPPSTLARDVPRGIDPICARATQKATADRYPDVDALRADVEVVRKALAPREKAGASEGSGGGALEWLSKHHAGVIVGFGIATVLYVPLVIVVAIIVRLASR